MSFLDLNLQDVPELVTVEEGEYEVAVRKAELRESNNNPGSKFIMLYMEVVGEPNSKDITMPLMLPNKEDDEKQAHRKLLRIKEACQAFGVSFDAKGFDVNEFTGRTADALLDEKEDEKYGVQNNVKRFVVPA